jgi:hypothetical protein
MREAEVNPITSEEKNAVDIITSKEHMGFST